MRWLEKAKQLLAANKMADFKTHVDNLGKILRAPGGTADQLEPLVPGRVERIDRSDFQAITRNTLEQVPVYRYKYADLPEQLTCAEIAASSRRRLSPEPTE
jgi:hypothetical protein